MAQHVRGGEGAFPGVVEARQGKVAEGQGDGEETEGPQPPQEATKRLLLVPGRLQEAVQGKERSRQGY